MRRSVLANVPAVRGWVAAPGGNGVANLASAIVDDGDLIEKE